MKEGIKVSVLGSGVMGIDLAILVGLAGHDVTLWHRHDRSIASRRLHERLDRYLSRAILSEDEVACVLGAVVVTESLEDVAGAFVIIESIVERLDAKRTLLFKLDDMITRNVVVATNTSTLSIRSLARGLKASSQVIGLHFFNPVLKMSLVEVIHTEDTKASVLNLALEFARSLRKEPVILLDSPGFVVNRLLMQYINSAAKIVESGVCSSGDVDRAMRLGANHPMGPLALADLIGLDIVVASLEHLYSELGDDSYRPCGLVRRLVGEGRVGRKVGVGFYDYSE